MKTWPTVLVVVLTDAVGNVYVTRGMKPVGEVATLRSWELLRLARRAMTNAMLGLGILCMAGSFFLFLALHSWADVSFVLPTTALAYPVSILGARYLLNENVTPARWIGTIFICIGVALISLQSGVK